MIIHNVEQGSPEWLAARLSIPTSSEFDRIVTPKGKLSAQSDKYLYRLLAEWITGAPLEDVQTEWMIRGHELESEAVSSYEFERGVACQKVGFITNDDGTVGTSPDRLVGDDGLLELKCPSPAIHVGYMISRSLGTEYWPQVQGQLLLTGREWCDIQSYHPQFPSVIIRVKPDEGYQEALREALRCFVEDLTRLKQELQTNYGVVPKKVWSKV
jgi:hypothetical protein